MEPRESRPPGSIGQGEDFHACDMNLITVELASRKFVHALRAACRRFRFATIHPGNQDVVSVGLEDMAQLLRNGREDDRHGRFLQRLLVLPRTSPPGSANLADSTDHRHGRWTEAIPRSHPGTGTLQPGRHHRGRQSTGLHGGTPGTRSHLLRTANQEHAGKSMPTRTLNSGSETGSLEFRVQNYRFRTRCPWTLQPCR